jgi:hypothetical protein
MRLTMVQLSVAPNAQDTDNERTEIVEYRPGCGCHCRNTSSPLAVASYQTRTAYMRCPRGKVILSGGFNVTPTGGQRRFSVARSQAGTAPDGAHNWTVTVANHGQDPIQFSISVVCAWAR